MEKKLKWIGLTIIAIGIAMIIVSGKMAKHNQQTREKRPPAEARAISAADFELYLEDQNNIEGLIAVMLKIKPKDLLIEVKNILILGLPTELENQPVSISGYAKGEYWDLVMTPPVKGMTIAHFLELGVGNKGIWETKKFPVIGKKGKNISQIVAEWNENFKKRKIPLEFIFNRQDQTLRVVVGWTE